MHVRSHLGDLSRNGKKRLLLQERLVHGGHVGFDMELIGFALGSLRLAQAEVVVGPSVMGDAEGQSKGTHVGSAHTRDERAADSTSPAGPKTGK